MKNILLQMLIIFLVFFLGAVNMLILDNICLETTGEGGKLVFNIAKLKFFQ